MLVVYSEKHTSHHPKYEIWNGEQAPYLEIPDRALSILKEIKGLWSVVDPSENAEAYIRELHSEQVIEFLQKNAEDKLIRKSEYPHLILDSDESLSVSSGTYRAAIESANSALTGAIYLLQGREKRIYSLSRPPGHHATKKKMGGFSYFNNAAIAAKHLSRGAKVGVLDIDLHHGNGTEDILSDMQNAFFVSIDGEDVYPYEEPNVPTDNAITLLVKGSATQNDYLSLIDRSLEFLVSSGSEAFVISAGFDTSVNEISSLEENRHIGLTRDTYYAIGKKIKEVNLPLLVVQEGGYNVDSLGKDVRAFLNGIDGK